MFKKRIANFSIACLGAICLLALFTLAIQVGQSAANGAGGWVIAAEKRETAAPGFGPSYPLFAGNDTTTLPQVQIDVTNSDFITAFIGIDAWGAAYDPVGDQVYHNDGSTNLYVWPVGGVPVALGPIVDAAGASVTIHGMAFYNGTLYGSSISTDIIYTIDPGTQVATPFISLVDTTASLSGLAADPTNGDLYGTDDISNDGLVRINPDGTLTLIAAYIGGETDVDGLAISPSRDAYLITDDNTPNFFNVFSLDTMTYTTVISYPWTGNAVQVSGAWIGEPVTPPQPGVVFTKTVGLDPLSCSSTDSLSIPAGGGGTNVTYCYTVTNTGTITLSMHLIEDDQLGIFGPDVFDIGPGETSFMTTTTSITQTTVNVATYTGSIVDTPSVTETDTATVTVLPPTDVNLTGFGGNDSAAQTPLWLAALFGLILIFSLTIRWRQTAEKND